MAKRRPQNSDPFLRPAAWDHHDTLAARLRDCVDVLAYHGFLDVLEQAELSKRLDRWVARNKHKRRAPVSGNPDIPAKIDPPSLPLLPARWMRPPKKK